MLQVLMSKTGIQYLESGIHSLESRIPDSPGFPYGATLKTLYKPRIFSGSLQYVKKSNDFDGLLLKA